MMSVSNVSPGAAANGYYKEEGYYKAGSPEAEKAAEWFGKAAEEAGLTGRVDDERFSQLLDGQAPDGKEMGRYVDGERQHRPGLDLTFSASKTASIAALVIGDERITHAHDAAVRAAMTVVEDRYIKTRYQIDGEMKTANAEGIIAGIYRHDTSRALDPNLHSHAVIANMVRNEKGEYTALRNEDIYNNRKVITEVYRSDFEARLKEMGIETQRGRYGEVNVAGISQEVVDGFSKRRQEIMQSLKGMGLENNPQNAAKATLATRAAKHKEIDRAELRAEWHNEAVEFGLDERLLDRGKIGPEAPAPVLRAIREPAQDPTELGRVAGIVAWIKGLIAAPETKDVETPESPEAQAVSKAIEHVSERQSVYERSALTAAALRFSGGASLEQVDKEIDRRIDAGALHAKGEYGETLTDRKSVALESSILETWRNSEDVSAPDIATTNKQSRVPDLQAALAQEKTLSEGQLAGIETALTGNGRYVGIQGYAGAGKTYMVQKLTDLAEQGGYEVKGFAPTHQAVKELDAVTGEASTLARVVISERTHPQQVDNSKAILLVDESSMVSARDMRSFMDYAERTNAARVVFVGDTKQLDAVSAGQPFAQLQEAGMRTAVMDEIIRQGDEGNLKDAVYNAIRGDIKSAFEKLGENVQQHESPCEKAAEAYFALPPDDRAETRVLTLTNRARAEINDAVRTGLKAEGVIAAEGTLINGLSSKPMTSVERSDAGSYALGDVVQPLVNSSNDGLKKDTLYVVQSVNTKSNGLTVLNEADGSRHDVPLSKTVAGRDLGASLVAYQSETRELSVGDGVRVRITDSKNELVNGERAVVTNADDGKVGLTTNDGREVEIDARSLGARGLEHDYAATAHSVQGETVDRVIVAMNAHEHLATQKSFYVEISRARYEATLITDNPEALAKNIADNTGVRMTAVQARDESQNQTLPDTTVKAVGWAVEHLSERNTTYLRSEVAVEALRRIPGADIDAVEKEIDRRVDEGSLFASDDNKTTLTDKASVALESSILMTYHASKTTAGVVLQSDGGRDGPAALAKKLSDSRTLSDGQKDAVMTSLTGEGQYVGVQGYAGTGKTTMVKGLRHYAEQNGYKVKGFAPTHQAVLELGKVLESPETLGKVLTEERHYPKHLDNSKTIIIVDEASMIGSRDMRTFMTYAERTNAVRVVFVGDTQQLDAVAAGQPFDRLQEAGMRTAIMDEIIRQSDEGKLKGAVYDAIRGDIKSAFEKLGENVQQHESPREKAAETYLALPPDERAETRVLTLTNRARAEINGAIREGLRDEGKVEGEDLKYSGLTNRKLTDAERVDARNYAPGDIVLSMVNSREHGLQKDATYLVRNFDGPRNRITVEHEETGERQILPLGATHNKREMGKSLVVYEKEQRELATGDQVRFRITDQKAGVTNGMRGHVTTTSDGVIEVKTREGNTVSLSADALAARGIELDYAATAHAVQGETVDRVIVAMDASEKLVTQKAFYVEVSRARDTATLITDDKDKLLKTIEGETGIRTNALEAWLESQRADDRDDHKDRAIGRDQDATNADPGKRKEQEKDEPAIGYLPGLFDEKTEAKLQEMEKQAELVRDRSKEITR